MEPLQIVFLGLNILLGVLLVYETIHYKRFLVAHHALISMSKGMQEGFNQIVAHLNKLSNDTLELRQSSALTDQEMNVIRTILSIHSKQLDVQTLDRMFEIVDALRKEDDA